MPTARRPAFWATSAVVPDPMNGSITVQGIGAWSGHSQVGCQPNVVTATPATVFAQEFPVPAAPVRLVKALGRSRVSCSRSVTRSHGLPQKGQQPSALVPARIHGSTSSGGKVAKWAPG